MYEEDALEAICEYMTLKKRLKMAEETLKITWSKTLKAEVERLEQEMHMRASAFKTAIVYMLD